MTLTLRDVVLGPNFKRILSFSSALPLFIAFMLNDER